MNPELIASVIAREKKAIAKWGPADTTPQIMLNSVMEEVGEVAHAINKNEGKQRVLDEIVDSIGVLSRLYDMVK